MAAKPKKPQLKKLGTIEYERQLWHAHYAPCGKFLVACGYDATLQRWRIDGEKPQQLQPCKGHNGWLQCMAFQPQPGLLFAADSWGKLAAWKYQHDQPQPSWQQAAAHDGWIRALSISPNGQFVATAGNDRVVRIWDAKSGSKKQEWQDGHPERIFSLAFHPDGKTLFSGDLKGTIRQTEFPQGKLVRKFAAGKLFTHHRIQECGGARVLALNAQGTQIVCAGQQDSKGGFAGGTPAAMVFDVATGKQLHQIKVGSNSDGFVYDAQFHPDGFIMATSSAFPGKGHLWFWKPGEKKPFLEDRKLTNGRSLSLHPTSRQIAMCASNSPNRNGRQLKDGKYVGGAAKIHLLEIA